MWGLAPESPQEQELPLTEEVFSETEGMYMYPALTRNGSGTYDGGKNTGALLFENLLGDRWGKGKEESGTR